ncbi:MAG: GNAT family N-acetyltransferase [Alphaproteobacteria bacterium]|nr:GNAT family N-acetyltransferase [Alphaproteobacteria bacterium]MBU1516985.1 GNAT family N-acetyltransferase [Alphaproteobacteria bacterium]MBU2094977.1 GNAT family N-acetyltransferase [Alphaproteobacteria bacterium]MBU2152526.1 GNAT family N-acetyltransferase [Alphaproteobacteria bacterium]MBU2308648.1 GNAT family N-acetyltransferase [Alphaproteobacteria bacterium]
MTAEILRVRPADAAMLDRIAIDVFDQPIDPARLAAYLAQPNHLMVVAVSQGEVVGQARGIVHRHPDLPTELYIDNLGVTPDRRRERLAMKLLDELVAWGVELGCEEAWVATEADNTAARALYAKRGAEAEAVVMFAYEGLAG